MFILLMLLVGWPLVITGIVVNTIWKEISSAVLLRFVILSLTMTAGLAWTIYGSPGQGIAVAVYAVSAVAWLLSLVQVSQPVYSSYTRRF